MEANSHFDSFESQLSVAARDFLTTAAGWAMFLAIVGFIFTGLGLLGALGIMAAGSTLDSTPGSLASMGIMSSSVMGLVLLLYVVLMFIPVLFLFKFSVSVRQAINESNTDKLTRSFGNLKNYFMWCGIFTIVWIVSYIGFIVLVISAASGLSGM